MDAQHTLVRIYLFVCQRYRRRLRAAAQRQSNNSQPDFTDEEVLTVYLFGLIKKRRTITEIYDYIADHFSEWFPEMPSYQGYNRRLCRLSAVFAPLVEEARARSSPRSSRRPERGLRPARRGGPSAVFAPLVEEARARSSPRSPGRPLRR